MIGAAWMMTNDKDRIQNAIRHIQTSADIDPWAVEIAVEAMKRQIPEKPMKSIDRYNENLYKLTCPACGKYIGYGNSRVGTLNKFTIAPDRCGYCGQKILWEEGEG